MPHKKTKGKRKVNKFFKTLSPLKAIRQYCLECGGSFKVVKDCSSTYCPLHIYRLGHDPQRKGIGVRANLFCSKSHHSSGQYFEKKGIVEGDLNIISQNG